MTIPYLFLGVAGETGREFVLALLPVLETVDLVYGLRTVVTTKGLFTAPNTPVCFGCCCRTHKSVHS